MTPFIIAPGVTHTIFITVINCKFVPEKFLLSFYRWSDGSNLSPQKVWSPDDIVTQVQPPPEEEEKSMFTSTTISIIIFAVLLFAYLVYSNMESTPQNPFS